MRTAIATGDYYVPGETMINRHFKLLFGGETCIVTGRYLGENPFGKPVFERRSPLSLADRVRFPAALLLNRLRYGTSRPPFGNRKRELAAFLREQRVEVVLAQFGTQALAVAPLAHEMGLPVFSYFRGTDASKSLQSGELVDAYRRCVPGLDGIFSVSQFLLDNLGKHGIHNQNAHVIPSGVDIRVFRPGQKRPQSCLAVGRMVEKKAPLVTIRAFARATRALPEARLTLAGAGPQLEPARALVRELGLQDRISLPGALSHDDVRRHLAEIEVFLQHSVTAADGNTEGLPIAIQEAMASGCIVISTRHAGIPEAVEDGVTGYLVDEHDEDGYADRIETVLSSGDRQELTANAREVAVARFDNNMLLDKLERLIRDTVAHRRGAPRPSVVAASK